jgi:hypothetical protein
VAQEEVNPHALQEGTEPKRSSRRNILALGAAAAAGAVVSSVFTETNAHAEHGAGEDPDALPVGELNETTKTTPTRLRANVASDALGPYGPNPPGSALDAFNQGIGWGLFGHGGPDATGGILGSSGGDGYGVFGSSQSGPGVHGNSLN